MGKKSIKSNNTETNQYLDYLADPNFQGGNGLFVLLFEKNAHQTSYPRYFSPNMKVKDYNVMNGGEETFLIASKK